MPNFTRWVCCPECKRVTEVLDDNTLVLHGCKRYELTKEGEFKEFVFIKPIPEPKPWWDIADLL